MKSLLNKAILTTLVTSSALLFTSMSADVIAQQQASSSVLGSSVQIRELKRMIVTQCNSAEASAPSIIIINPVIGQDGEPSMPDVEYEDEPLPVDTTCITVDSHLNAGDVDGELLVWNDPTTGTIDSMIFRANVRAGSRAYSLADWVLSKGFSPNGAVYQFESILIQDDDGMPLEYPITFIRRSPDEQTVTIDGVETVVPNYDVTTTFKIEKEIDGGILMFFLDFRN